MGTVGTTQNIRTDLQERKGALFSLMPCLWTRWTYS